MTADSQFTCYIIITLGLTCSNNSIDNNTLPVCVNTVVNLCGYEPFYSENEQDMYRRILKCDYQFDSPWWDDVSANAKVHHHLPFIIILHT